MKQFRRKRKNLEKELNIVLDKINREGYNSLTKDEQDVLYKNSKFFCVIYLKTKKRINSHSEITL